MSGLSPSQADQIEEQWWHQQFPGEFERVRVIVDARERVRAGGSVLLSNVERLVDRKELEAARVKAKAAADATKEADPA